MESSKIDLHIHSCFSDDGEYTPKELFQLCQEAKIEMFAIADHNSVKGNIDAEKYDDLFPVKRINAIEIDCTYNNVNLHLLGYRIDVHQDCFKKLENFVYEQEVAASEKKVKAIEELGIFINKDKLLNLSRNGIITGEMIAESSIHETENRNNNLITPYINGGIRSDNPYVNFYWDLCSQGKPAYVKISYITLDEAVSLVKASGGVPVLAHPGVNIKDNINLLNGIIDSGVVGIEAYSSYHNKEEANYYHKLAFDKNIFVTCGSDFHGKTKPSIELGEFVTDDLFSEEEIKIFFNF